ncbi:DNA polymerase I [Oharaeibacter diazotrophicus]|uniref:DNA polymerase I n=3 Tax=Oharaeibacter diazotrophicus TaxID=1920512 RepID=A0A4R6R7J4_9HYPH|nr:DNA polymerase I [Oharaeibacter diazotrophicus]TDP81951.1 DNA polymerase I [Oharaeibacter diazotrophicus]BBE73583.1 DNA polymerase I [Pleomorphomonas sp. SM30]GLS75373.1 DNA polymerase I [Oharaeibacter diazotrophicus]
MSNDAPSRPVTAGDHVFLVDGSGYIFRAYHALPPLTRKSDGVPVGAVAGFCNMLWRLLKEADHTAAGVKPTHLAVVFDASSVTFRNEIYPLYKAQRPEPPEDLRPQFGLIREAVRAFNVACVEQLGFEADDLIATYTTQARAAGADVTIVSSDKDLMQLVDDKVVLLDTMKDKRLGIPEVAEKFGVTPDKVVDVQSLAGDSVDNVPGVPGIGIKTAAQLILEYGDLEGLLARAGEIKQPKRRESLIQYAEQARISRRLVELDRAVPLDHPIDGLGVRPVDGERLIAFCKAMEFSTLTRRVAEATGVDTGKVAAVTVPVRHWPAGGDAGLEGAAAAPVAEAADGGAAAPAAEAGAAVAEASASGPTTNAHGDVASTPAARVAAAAAAMRAVPVDHSAYETVLDAARLAAWAAEAAEAGVVAFDTETNALDPMRADLVGVSLALAPGKACYVPLAHVAGAGDLLGGGLVPGQIPLATAVEILKPVLEAADVLKIGQNVKYDRLVLERHGIVVAPFDDTMLISYALDAGRNGHGMDEMSELLLGHKPIAYKDVCGSGKGAITFDKVPLDRATAYAAEDADVTLRLWHVLKPRLVAEGMTTVYETLERPLLPVLARMETRGIQIDRQILSRLSGEFAQKMAGMEAEIQALAGEPINPGSPKQLGDILFGKMGLPGAKKTKTGAWATGADVLEDLAEQGHELPRKVLDWRQLSKLKSTYTDALPTYVHPETHRVHTSFSMASTTTGRLSSSEPNLQNIPVRTEEGRKIRTAFVAPPGRKLISADYSQIELRVLAHVADIPQLKRAFADGLDIHAMTASEMFGVPVQGMDPMVRRRAKAINFGIIYGISAFGLANQLGISREEAGDYIKRYFQRFPGIRDYMDTTRRTAREQGYVTTLFGRKAHYPDIASPNASMRAFMERAAINAPIQGSAADVIRRAMVRMEGALVEAGLSALLLLQVHDELVFEVPDAEVEATIPVVVKVMAGAAEPAVRLSVPLEVEARAAQNWEEAH